MRNIMFLSLGLSLLCAMSFIGASSKSEMIESEEGTFLASTHFLTVGDLEYLQKETVFGAKTFTLIRKSLKPNYWDDTIYTDQLKVSSGQYAKMSSVLAKY